MPTIERLANLTPVDRAALLAPLDEFSRARGFPYEPRELVLALRDDAGNVSGGLIGQLHWGWLRIEILAVPACLRGQGLGRQLVARAEALALAAGCPQAWVDTFTFQSPGFYLRLGYQVFAELPDYPPGQARIFLRKKLTFG
ncbi:MAG: GNAT family N-acetyltransferase [Gemmataceae bacterium]